MMKKSTTYKRGITWGLQDILKDLDYADDSFFDMRSKKIKLAKPQRSWDAYHENIIYHQSFCQDMLRGNRRILIQTIL